MSASPAWDVTELYELLVTLAPAFVFALVVLVLVVTCCFVSVPAESVTVLSRRDGKLSRVVGPGTHWVVPLQERAVSVEWTSSEDMHAPAVLRRPPTAATAIRVVAQPRVDLGEVEMRTRDGAVAAVRLAYVARVVQPSVAAFVRGDVAQLVAVAVRDATSAVIGESDATDVCDVSPAVRRRAGKSLAAFGVELDELDVHALAASPIARSEPVRGAVRGAASSVDADGIVATARARAEAMRVMHEAQMEILHSLQRANVSDTQLAYLNALKKER